MKQTKGSTYNLIINLDPHLIEIYDNVELFNFILLSTIKSIVLGKTLMCHQDDLILELKEHEIGSCQCNVYSSMCPDCLSKVYLDKYIILISELLYKEVLLIEEDKNNLLYCVNYNDFMDSAVVRFYGVALIGVELYDNR